MITRKAKTITVATGDLLMGKRVTNLLKDMGHRTVLASNGNEAVKAVDEGVDLIVLDLSSAEMNAASILDYLMLRPPSTRTPVVAITAREDAGAFEHPAVTDAIDRDRVNPEALAYKVNRALFSGQEPVDSRKRVPVSITTVFAVDGQTGTGTLMNLSEGGAFMHTDHNINEGAHIELTFYLEDELITARGLVKWSAPGPKDNLFCGAGITFTSLPSESHKRLSEFVRARLEDNDAEKRRVG